MITAYVFITSHIADLQAKRDERGATAVEYGLMVALIAVAIVVTVGLLGDELNALFESITTSLGSTGGTTT